MKTQNGLKLLGGRAGLLECVYKDESGFDYSFSLEGQILNVSSLQSPLLPVNDGDETLVVCDKKGRVLGLKNRSLNSALQVLQSLFGLVTAQASVILRLFAQLRAKCKLISVNLCAPVLKFNTVVV